MEFKSLRWIVFVLLFITPFLVKASEQSVVNNEDQCKTLGSVQKRCSVCKRSDLQTNLKQYQELYNGHLNKEAIKNHLPSIYSCHSVDDLFDFHDGCSNDKPCPNSVLSIFPPSTENDWCYIQIYAPLQNFEIQDEISRFPEDVIYLKGNRSSCSKNKKWVLSAKDNLLLKYQLERNHWETGM